MKNVVITDSTRGLGLCMVEEFLNYGCNVTVSGSNDMIQEKTVVYGTSKHALTYFTKGIAKELNGKQVKVGRLSPGMMLDEFITKTPKGEQSPVLDNKRFQKIFNILGDKPETVAKFFIPRILNNTKNNAHIVWLNNTKSFIRFTTSILKNVN